MAKGDCGDLTCQGWAIFNGNQIQRCDACNVYKTDEEAVESVLAGMERARSIMKPVTVLLSTSEWAEIMSAMESWISRVTSRYVDPKNPNNVEWVESLKVTHKYLQVVLERHGVTY
jgi:hypothetical protein